MLLKQMLMFSSELGAERGQSPVESNPTVQDGPVGVTDKVAPTEQNTSRSSRRASACRAVII